MQKHLKPIDKFHIIIYIGILFISLLGKNYVVSIFVLFAMLHYFPLVYLLRKHGYLNSEGGMGYLATKKGIELINTFYTAIKTLSLNLLIALLLIMLYFLTLPFLMKLYQLYM